MGIAISSLAGPTSLETDSGALKPVSSPLTATRFNAATKPSAGSGLFSSSGLPAETRLSPWSGLFAETGLPMVSGLSVEPRLSAGVGVFEGAVK